MSKKETVVAKVERLKEELAAAEDELLNSIGFKRYMYRSELDDIMNFKYAKVISDTDPIDNDDVEQLISVTFKVNKLNKTELKEANKYINGDY